jgi:hypothetical protein
MYHPALCHPVPLFSRFRRRKLELFHLFYSLFYYIEEVS